MPSAEKAKPGRVVTVFPVDVAEDLDRLAIRRFGGNRTSALVSAVRLALAVYGADANRNRLVEDELDALAALGAKL